MRFRRLFFAGLLLITACSSGSNTPAANAPVSLTAQEKLPVVALPGYDVSVFTQNDSRLIVSNPDAIEVDGQHVFIDYQNVTAKDCSDADKVHSTVIEYDMTGKILGHWDVAGHSDGMRVDPATHIVWTTSCEDGSPRFATIDPSTNTVTPYAFPSPPHGGGYDDLYFLNGSTFIAASNPTVDANGNNPFPAIDKIALANGKMTLTPVLYGNASAADLLNNNTASGMTLTDPDSLNVDANGQLVLVSQADSLLVFIKNPGASGQTVSKMAVGTQLDDTVFPTGPGRLLVVDAGSGVTYWIKGNFAKGDIYTQSPNDSGVDNFVATVAPATGFVTPIAIGFGKATGMVFVPNS
jgi:hypothetical protein